MNIPVLMTTDDNYILQTKTAIFSMRKNTNQSEHINVTILCSKDLSKNGEDNLKSLEEKLCNLSIDFFEVDSHLFKDAIAVGRIALCSFYRLIMDEVVHEDKCLFLDGVMIIECDLLELYEVDVSDVYVAGVRDVSFVLNPDWARQHREKYGFLDMFSYINAGVLVINLKRIRENRLRTRFIEEMSNGYPYMDQDVINKVCFGGIKILPYEYNCFHMISNIRGVMGRRLDSIKVYHYPGEYKPWNYLRTRYAKKWWEYAKMALSGVEYSLMYENAQLFTRFSDWSEILKLCKRETRIAIIGFSKAGVHVYSSLLINNVKAEIIICDNDKKKQRDLGNGISVCSVEEIANSIQSTLWIVISQRYRGEIRKQLQDYNVPEDKIVFFVDKNSDYFETLSDEFVDYETSDLKLLNYGICQKM